MRVKAWNYFYEAAGWLVNGIHRAYNELEFSLDSPRWTLTLLVPPAHPNWHPAPYPQPQDECFDVGTLLPRQSLQLVSLLAIESSFNALAMGSEIVSSPDYAASLADIFRNRTLSGVVGLATPAGR